MATEPCRHVTRGHTAQLRANASRGWACPPGPGPQTSRVSYSWAQLPTGEPQTSHPGPSFSAPLPLTHHLVLGQPSVPSPPPSSSNMFLGVKPMMALEICLPWSV